MNYLNYVIAAYAVFFGVLAWDFFAPRIAIRQSLRAAKNRAVRQAASDKNAPLAREP